MISACPFCNGETEKKEGMKKVCKECGFQTFPIKSDTLTVSPHYVKQKLAKKETILLLDVRRLDEVGMAKISEARWMPMDELPKRSKQIDLNQEIVCYCHHGNRSLYAANFLLQKGFKNVKTMDGGIDRWSREIDQRVARY